MLEWTDVDLAVRDAVREFVDKEIRPHVDDLESGAMEPYPVIRKLFATFGIADMARESLEKRLAKLRDGGQSGKSSSGGGMFGGGSGGMGFVVVSELCKVSMGIVTGMGVSLGLTVPTIQGRGTLAQQERWLPDLVTYDKIGAWAITEPDSGSDAFGGMKSYVVRDGNGDYILNGQKTFITNGPDADVVVVYAKLNEGEAGGSSSNKRDREVLTFVLDRGMEGFIQSKPFSKMGIHSSRTGELYFNNVRLGRDRLLGETEDSSAGDGRASARSNFSAERIGVAAMSLGVIEECLRLCVDYAKTRKLWGQEIGQFQLIQLKLANMEVARMNVRNILFRVIEAAEKGQSISLPEASAIKWYCSQAATDTAMEAVQVFGGNGYMTEYRVEQLARDAKSLMIYAGSNEVQITHVARGLLNGGEAAAGGISAATSSCSARTRL
jgi:alkylation response protein AidB-like acyl-CoA dehydrogenase